MSRSLSHEGGWTRWVSLALAALLGVLVWEAVSDEPAPPDQPHRVPVAVIDIARVFKDHRPFNERMSAIKGEIEIFEGDLRTRRELIAGTKITDRDKAAELEKELQAEVELKRRDFLEQEAVVYFEIYSEIESSVARLCRERGIGLVLRYNTDPMVKGDRASVLQGVNRAVVHHRVPDLTGDVLGVANSARKL